MTAYDDSCNAFYEVPPGTKFLVSGKVYMKLNPDMFGSRAFLADLEDGQIVHMHELWESMGRRIKDRYPWQVDLAVIPLGEKGCSHFESESYSRDRSGNTPSLLDRSGNTPSLLGRSGNTPSLPRNSFEEANLELQTCTRWEEELE